MMLRFGLTLTSLAVLATACTLDPGAEVDTIGAELRVGRPTRIQAGPKLFVLGVTDDDHAIFQDGTKLYATALYPGAPRRFIAETGVQVGIRNPLVFVSGNVAFIWPDSGFSGTTVSRLLVWTAAGGAKLAAGASLGWRGAVAASPDSRQIVFIANASADGTVGDLVNTTADLRSQATLVTGANIDPFGNCPLLVGFDRKPVADREDVADSDRDGRGRTAHPVAGYCQGMSTTKVLSRWIDGRKADLASDIQGFPLWSTDTRGDKLFTLVGSPRDNQRPVSIDAHGVSTVIEDVFTGGGSINSDDTIMTFARPGATFEMHRFTGRPPRPSVVADIGRPFFIYFKNFPRFLQDYTAGFTSSTGLSLYANPTTGGRQNLFIVDTTQAPATPVSLQQDAACGPSFEPFTADSRHALIYCADPATVEALFDATPSGTIRPLSVGSAEDFANFAVDGSVVTFADGFRHTPEDQDLSATVDIKRADLESATLAPTTLVSQAYTLYFPSGDRRRIVYTWDRDPASPGLFVLRVR